uniref:Na+/H+ antiporter NhaC family protein n=1 Tax=Candidatus Aschnera chinzeii TaxID=1485666 RepID=A0AAT9G4I2_9ENTR|nr:MAG: Na+/H+ antiporter NhaC family protein [Candidatus Aschnera chinzeii]
MIINYGFWTIIVPLVIIVMALITREVLSSLLVGIIMGYMVISHGNIIAAMHLMCKGIVDICISPSNIRTMIFIILIGGVVRLIHITHGVIGLANLIITTKFFVKNKITIQLLAMCISMLIFVESSINQLVAGISTKHLARYYGISAAKMAYIIQTSGISVCSSVMINGWGAAMMGIINIQISNGLISGEPFQILTAAMRYNIMAWLSLLSVLFYIITDVSWGRMKISENIANQLKNNYSKLESLNKNINYKIPSTAVWNFFIPIIVIFFIIPIVLFITGNGEFTKGNGSISVYWSVIIATIVSSIWYLMKRILTFEIFFNEIYNGYTSMFKITCVMLLAFLIGKVLNELNISVYIADIFVGILPSQFSVVFIFIISSLMSLATGTSWGTFSIMIPIAIQLGVALNISIDLMIGAAVSGSIFGDMTSPISSDAIIASMATDCNHIEHIKTQMPYAMVTAMIAIIIYLYLGYQL